MYVKICHFQTDRQYGRLGVGNSHQGAEKNHGVAVAHGIEKKAQNLINEALFHHEFGNLNRIRCSAFAEIISNNPHIE
jgi:hypothetical protein